VNLTQIYNLNVTSDFLSVSEESFVIDEEDECSDQTQSVEPSDKQTYSNNSDKSSSDQPP